MQPYFPQARASRIPTLTLGFVIEGLNATGRRASDTAMTGVQTDGSPASCKVVLAGVVAKDLMLEVSEGLAKVGKAPLLVGFLANGDPAARKYAEWTERTCQEK